MNDESYTLKDLKEAFVTGHDGTKRIELILVCLSSPVGMFLYLECNKMIMNYLSKQGDGNVTQSQTSLSSKKKRMHERTQKSLIIIIQIVIESFTILLPMTMCQTNLLYPWGVSLLSFELILALILRKLTKYSLGIDHIRSIAMAKDIRNRSKAFTKRNILYSFLTIYRASVSFLTFVAILAVDFHVFPRRFAKTETIGYSLMDLGAGSFVVSAGFVSKYARKQLLQQQRQHQRDNNEISKKDSTISKTIIQSIPLLILGVIRLLTNKSLEYQEHVSEYGIHWNFFFTLSIVNMLSAILRKFSSAYPYPIRNTRYFVLSSSTKSSTLQFAYFAFDFLISPSSIVLILYQICLSRYHLQQYIEDANRQCLLNNYSNMYTKTLCNLFAANREGILGCIGYLVLFFMSEEIAMFCLWDDKLTNETIGKKDKRMETLLSPTSDSKSLNGNSYLTSISKKQNIEGIHQRNLKAEKQTNNDAKNPMNVPTHESSKTQSLSVLLLQGERMLKCLGLLILYDFILTIIFQIPSSRRSTNAPFVIWILEFNLAFLFLFWSVFALSGYHSTRSIKLPSSSNASVAITTSTTNSDKGFNLHPSPIFSAVNRNGLLIFVIANLLTGAVNITINTLETSDVNALGIIFVYLCSIGAIALILDKGLNVTIKI